MSAPIFTQEHSIQESEPKQKNAHLSRIENDSSSSSTEIDTVAIQHKSSFKPFVGRIKGNKVRLRSQPTLDSPVIRELQRGEYLTINGESELFYNVVPPADTKAYVFRTFVLDGVIEGNRVNVRIEPRLDSPVIAQLNTGDSVEGVISTESSKWLEITPPKSTHFYVAKEFVEYAGEKDYLKTLEKRREEARQLLYAAQFMAHAELQKDISKVDLKQILLDYEKISATYADIPDILELAQFQLNQIQKEYWIKQKRYPYEPVSDNANLEKNTDFATFLNPIDVPLEEREVKQHLELQLTDKMKLWQPIEEELFKTWQQQHGSEKQIEDFYLDQQLHAIKLKGIIEPYLLPIKNKPGDYLLLDHKRIPIGYLYSTVINLQEFVGQEVSIIATERSNHHFAFRAYFVLGIASS
ncbi:MAG: hypothetical protein K0S74_460 [Chlamydiales bacterium]|jgi:hypothetical protein|nr:hypothetical protein [Chlamydiales bacterium]